MSLLLGEKTSLASSSSLPPRPQIGMRRTGHHHNRPQQSRRLYSDQGYLSLGINICIIGMQGGSTGDHVGDGIVVSGQTQESKRSSWLRTMGSHAIPPPSFPSIGLASPLLSMGHPKVEWWVFVEQEKIKGASQNIKS